MALSETGRSRLSEDGTLTVFHGTRTSLASRIERSGFEPLDVLEQITLVAATHGIDKDELLRDLELHGRFAMNDSRSGTVSVATNELQGANWANRAPEATWESLWAVYRLWHPELGFDWNLSDDGHLWVLGQQISDPPVVISIEISADRLRHEADGGPVGQSLLTLAPPTYDSLRFRFDTPTDAVVRGIDPVPVRIDSVLARYMSGEIVEVFARQVEGGKWGPLHRDSPWSDPWFAFEGIWEGLSEDRREHLLSIMQPPSGSI